MEQNIEIDLNSDVFDYTGTFKIKSVVDWNKLDYNSSYRTPEYFRNKFPSGFDYLAGFDTIFQEMALNAKSPLEEILLSSNSNNDNQNDEPRDCSNISEFKNSE